MALATLKAVQLQLNGMLMRWKTQQAMQDDNIRMPRPLPLRGHVTNASFKQWVRILRDSKNWQSTQKLSYTQNLRGNAFKGDILWHFGFSTK